MQGITLAKQDARERCASVDRLFAGDGMVFGYTHYPASIHAVPGVFDAQFCPSEDTRFGNRMIAGGQPLIAHFGKVLRDERAPNPKRNTGRGSTLQADEPIFRRINPGLALDQELALVLRNDLKYIA